MSGKYPGGFVTLGAPAGYSVAFDGTGDYLTLPSSVAFGFGTGDFTVEAWYYFTGTIGTYQRPWWFGDDNDNTEISSSVIRVGGASQGTLITGTTTLVANRWYHIALTRASGTYRLWLNGVQEGSSATNSYNSSARTLGIAATTSGSNPITGSISNFRILKGTALYTAAFTPPTQLFSITNTSLLTCQSPNIIDNSSNAFAITANGNATASTFTPFVGYTAGASGFQPALGAAAPGVWTLDEATYYQQNRLWPIYDPYFNQTTLMLHGVGSNTANNSVFVDSSSNNFAITRNGNTTQGTFTPFSQTGWSNNLTGSATSLRMAANSAFDQNAGSFSIECWVYPSTIAAGGLYIYGAQGNDQLLMLAYGYTTGLFKIDQGGGGGGIRITSANTYAANTWHHVAYTYDGTTLKLFINGNLQGTATSLTTIASPAVAIGEFGSSSYFNGYVSNFRICRAAIPTAYQTASTTVGAQIFTPATTPLTTTSQGASNVSFLTCQSNNFVDNSTTPKAITITGTPSVQAFSPFPPTTAYTTRLVGGSGYFDGTGDSLASTTDFESSTSISTFTIDGWVYPTTFSTLINVIGGMVVSSGDQKSIAAEVNTSGQVALYWFDGAIKRCTGNSVMQLNAWNYFAIVVTSNAIAIYVNKTTADTLSGTTTLTNRAQSTDLGVGAYYNNNAPAQYFNGYLSNIRYSTTARTISVPTTPFVSDGNTRWLLNYTNAGIIDSTADNVLETLGNASISTVQSKYGGSSMYFDGTGDYLLAPFSQNFQLGTGDFTIEFWINASASGTYNQVVGTLVSGTEAGTWRVGNRYNSTNTVFFARGSGGGFEEAQYTVNVNDGAWHHVACVRLAGVIYMYVDGVARALTAGSASISGTCSSSNAFYVGYNGRDNSYITGYLDDVRITKGIARYIGNFTPPTSQLQSQ